MRRLQVPVIAMLTLFLCVSSLAAQDCVSPLPERLNGPTRPACLPAESRVDKHLKTFGVNAAIGGVTAGVSNSIRGNSFWKGFVGGALGGGLSYAGKRVAAAEFSGSGLLGRQINAVGASMVANASANTGLLRKVSLLAGPVRLDVATGSSVSVRPRVDVANVLYTVYVATLPEMRLDWSESMSSGTWIFVDRSKSYFWNGRHAVGLIMVKENFQSNNSAEEWRRVQKHETIHLLQHDFTSLAWGRPAEGWLLNKIPGGAKVHSFADFRLDILAWEAMRLLMPHEDRPSEKEAYFHTGDGLSP